METMKDLVGEPTLGMAGPVSEPGALWRRGWRNLRRNKAALLGLVILAGVVLTALLASHLAPADPNHQELALRLLPPAWATGGKATHSLGTDQLGRDILSRIIYGSRISLLVGVTTVAVAGALGTFLGLLSGYYGGWVDDVIMRLADIQLAFPFVLLALAVMAVLGPGLKNIIIVLGITGWVEYGRVVRAEVLSLRSRDFVEAARAIGDRDAVILGRHVLPNVATSLIVIATLQMGRMIISESALTFLGLGIEPTIPTWGGMLNDGRNYMNNQWWVSTFPGLALLLTVLASNLVGDWLRDTLDPTLKE
ncbi:MAG: ABC transporter permease [Firmicutes bacterium]|nr:ABC transporter permease [Bacillota bacterium]